MLPLWFIITVGLCIGSFLNVCIARIPYEQSIVRPRSRCPKCEHEIAWYENIPVVSFLFLRARCRHCRAPISWRYPLVEILTAALAWATWWHLQHAPFPSALWFFFFMAPLIAITFIDLDHQIIPDLFSLSGIVTGLATRLLLAPADARMAAFGDAVVGALVGAGLLWGVAWAYEKLRHQEGLGMGDVKLMAMLGAFLGVKGVAFIILGSSLLGSIVGGFAILVLRRGLRFAMPFGPFIAIAAVVYFFVGEPLVDWYIGLYTMAR